MSRSQEPRFYYGWRVVAAAFMMAVFAWGLGFYGPSVYVNELVRSRGWSVYQVSSAVTFHFLFSAALILFLAEAHARFGIVRVTRFAIVAYGLGIIGWSHATEAWQLFPAAALTGIGWAGMSAAAINAFISPWFAAKRPIALSHAYNGASMGGVLFSPLWAFLIDAYGFRHATLMVAAGGLVVLWPLAGRYFARRPVDFGLHPDGVVAAPAQIEADTALLSRGALLRDVRFVSLALAFAIAIFAQMGLLTHLVVRLTPTLGAQGAALALSLATACAMIGRLVLGAAIGADARREAGMLNFCVQAVGVTLLCLEDSPALLLAGCILFGLGIGNLLSLPPLILQAELRAADIPRALALLTAINQFLYAFAPGAFGYLRDLTGDYRAPFALAVATQLLSAVVLVAVRRQPAAITK